MTIEKDHRGCGCKRKTIGDRFRWRIKSGRPEPVPDGLYVADPKGNLIEIGSWNKPYEAKNLTEE